MDKNTKNTQMDNTMKLKKFRKQKLSGILDDLAGCAMGYNLPFQPFITNRQRQFSPEKADQLLDCLTDIPEITAVSYTNASKLRDFYRSLLYCALRALTTSYTFFEHGNRYNVGSRPKSASFDDLLQMLHSSEDFLESGSHKHPVDSLLASAMHSLYFALSGKKSPEASLLDGTFIPDEDAEEIPAEPEYSEEDPAILKESQWLLNEEMEHQALAASEMLRVRQSFAAPEDYCRHYENVLTLFPEQYFEQLFNLDISKMIDHFLMEQELTLFDHEELYLNAIVSLKKIMKQITAEQEV